MGFFSKEKSDEDQLLDRSGNIDFGSVSGYHKNLDSLGKEGIEIAPVKAAAANRDKLKSTYGIEDTIQLMRSLPDQSDKIIITVVQKTLESMNVRVSDIVKDAGSKETRVKNRINTLIEEIAEFSKKINERETEISSLESDLKETQQVRASLESVIPESELANNTIAEKSEESANDEAPAESSTEQNIDLNPKAKKGKTKAIPA